MTFASFLSWPVKHSLGNIKNCLRELSLLASLFCIICSICTRAGSAPCRGGGWGWFHPLPAIAFTHCLPNCTLAAWLPGATIKLTGGICSAGRWFIISFNGHFIGSFSGCLVEGSGVDVLNLLCGGVGYVYKSSDEAECLLIWRLVTVMFSVPSISESNSELLLSSVWEGELYCAPVSLTCNISCISVCVCWSFLYL